MKYFYLIGSLILTISSTSSAQTIKDYIKNDWPDSRYQVHDNGTATDTYTGLMWKVCSEGQTWSSLATCSGTATIHNWQEALELAISASFAGFEDWRLPNIVELRSIVSYDRYNPAINITVFPSTQSSYYWSSSPIAYNSYEARLVYFYDGDDYYTSHARDTKNFVRLVRGRQ